MTMRWRNDRARSIDDVGAAKILFMGFREARRGNHDVRAVQLIPFRRTGRHEGTNRRPIISRGVIRIARSGLRQLHGK